MRFSAAFQLPLTPRIAAERPGPERVAEPVASVLPVPQAPLFADLPEDLDQRVRMIGEWQLGEG